MIVGGGTAPATNLTRHEVQRPRPPQVAVMSTPPPWAALRIDVPGARSSVRRAPGSRGSVRIVSATAMSSHSSGMLPPMEIDLDSMRSAVRLAGFDLRDAVPTEDSTVVARLAAAGLIVLGKLNMHEFAYGPEGLNAHYGDAMNPWDGGAHRVAGGSSSGSGVAVAAALCPGALGSDTGGSIRIPASLCGISGLKPTYGRVSRAGVLPLSWSMDHGGPMARTVEDFAPMLRAMAGYDPADP